MGVTVTALAALVGGVVEGDGAREISGVRGLETAEAGHVSFLANRRYVRLLKATRAGAVFVGRSQAAHGRTVIRCDDPYLAFARALEAFHPVGAVIPGVHPLAVVEGEVAGVQVMAFAYVGAGAKVGEGSVLHPHSYVGPGARVGTGCVLMAGSVVAAGCVVGDRVVLNPGAVVGGDGFGFVPTAAGHVKIPQTGRAVLGDDVELGANACVDRAAVGDTSIGRGTKVDNFVQVGHGATVGEGCLLVAYAGVAGSAVLGDRVVLAARSGVLGHLEVGDGVQVGAMALVTEDTPAGARRSGYPAMDHARWLRVVTVVPELPELERRLRAIEARLARENP